MNTIQVGRNLRAARRESQVLTDGERWEQPSPLWNQCNAQPHETTRRHPIEPTPLKLHRTPRRRSHAEYGLDESCLADSVSPDNSYRLFLCDMEAHVMKHMTSTTPSIEMLDGEERFIQSQGRSPSLSDLP